MACPPMSAAQRAITVRNTAGKRASAAVRGRIGSVLRRALGRVLCPATLLAALLGQGCALVPAVGGGGPLYEVSVHSINGRPTAANGPAAYPACTIQVGDRAARVWLAADPPRSRPSPPVLQADAEALMAGILVEASWEAAVVHEITPEELAAEAAVIHVPYPGGFHTVELRFHRIVPPIAAK